MMKGMRSFPKSGRGKKFIVVVIVAAIVIVAFTLVSYYRSAPIIFPSTQIQTYSVDNSTGLELIAKTSGSEIDSGNSISISVKVFNTMGSLNVLDNKQDFPQMNSDYVFSVSICNYAPFGIAIAKGNYSLNNLNSATPLMLFEPSIVPCPMKQVTQYQFYAHSTKAKMYNPNNQPSIIGTTDFLAAFNLSGYWTGNMTNHSFHEFSPDVYTIISADGWGQVLILHFSVS